MKEERKIFACWLASVPGIGNRTIEKLLALGKDEKEIYDAGETLWRQVLTARQMDQIRGFAAQREPEALYQQLLQKEIQIILREEAEYPKRLQEIPDPPYALFVKGQLPVNEKPSVAVVGARDCSEYGRFMAEEIGRMLGENDIQVISGMARGVDGICQKAALRVGGSSFGVLGSGVDVCYPLSNRSLYDSLCEAGGILSTYPPGTEARAGNFPPRNRIVSGLSDVLIVVEARSKSGTLITVDMALEQGKDVYVVPGRITDRLSDGCNMLLRQGAEVFLSPELFLRELGERWNCRPAGGDPENFWANPTWMGGQEERNEGKILQWHPVAGAEGLSQEEKDIYAVLEFDPATPEQIRERLREKYPLHKLMGLLMGLCAEGLAQQISPGYFVKKSKQK